MDKFTALKFFLMVTSKGSFASAAKTLGSDPSTVSKAVNRLEQTLGFRLFQRSTRSLTLTPDGLKYQQTVQHILEELSSCEEALTAENKTPTGTLKINAPVAYGRLYIVPLITKFNNHYPEINIHLTLDDAYIDMIEQGYDLSIRTGTLQDNRLVARQLSNMEMVTVAAPEQAKKLTNALIFEQFESIDWLQFKFKQSGKLAPIFGEQNNQFKSYQPTYSTCSDDGEALIEFCAAGMGFVQLPHFLVKHALQQKRLLPVMSSFSSGDYGIYAIYPKREFLPVRTSIFIDFIKQELDKMNESPTRNWAQKLSPLEYVEPNIFNKNNA